MIHKKLVFESCMLLVVSAVLFGVGYLVAQENEPSGETLLKSYMEDYYVSSVVPFDKSQGFFHVDLRSQKRNLRFRNVSLSIQVFDKINKVTFIDLYEDVVHGNKSQSLYMNCDRFQFFVKKHSKKILEISKKYFAEEQMDSWEQLSADHDFWLTQHASLDCDRKRDVGEWMTHLKQLSDQRNQWRQEQ
ncbi:MAG: hypothetical protein R3A11_07255 [Bdellovibrionota bacterium]